MFDYDMDFRDYGTLDEIEKEIETHMKNYETLAKQYHDIERMIKELEANKKAIASEIITMMQNDDITRYNGMDYDITLIDSESTIFDTQAFKQAYSGLYEAFRNKVTRRQYIKVS